MGDSEVVVHHGVVCDWCLAENITGCRYKCKQCDNFDLCESCMDRPQGVRTSYSGHFSHPDLFSGLQKEVFINLRTTAGGYWTVDGQNQDIVASVSGGHFKVQDKETIFDGQENGAGVITGTVCQNGQTSGSFSLEQVAVTVHNPSHTFEPIRKHLSQEEDMIAECESCALKFGLHSQEHKEALFMLADFYRLTQNVVKAMPLYEDAIEGWPLVGNSSMNRHYVICLNNCSITYLSVGDISKAEVHAENAVGLCKRYFHQDGELLGACLNTLAQVRRQQRRFLESHSLFEEALAAERSAYGEVSKACMLTLNNLANLEEFCGQLCAAELHYQQAIEMQEAVDPTYLTALVSFSDLLYQQGRFSEAYPLTHRAIAILQNKSGSEQVPSLSVNFIQLGECFLQLGKLDDAEQRLQQGRELASSLPAGQLFPLIQKAKALQSRCLAYRNKFDAASKLALEAREELMSELASQRVRQAGASVASCMFLVADALEACRCFGEAKSTVEKAFLLPADPTVAHLQIVAQIIQQGIDIGKREDAAALAREARKRKVENWGLSTNTNGFIEQHFRLLRYYGKLKLDLDHQEFEENMKQLEMLSRAHEGVGLAKLKLEKAKALILQPQSSMCFHQAKSLLQEAAASQQTYEPRNRTLELKIKVELAGLLANGLGEFAEAERLVESFKDCSPMTNANTVEQIMTLLRLAKLQTQLGRAEEGLATLEEALRLAENKWGRNCGCAMSCVHDLGRHYYFEMHQLDEARKLLTEAKNFRLRLGGKNHPDVFSSNCFLGEIYLELGQLDEAEEALSAALEISQETHNPCSTDRTLVLSTLAELKLRRGEFDKAHSLLKTVEDTRQKLLGESHPMRVRTLIQLAQLFLLSGAFQEAVAYSEVAVEKAQEVLGRGHRSYRLALSSFGAALARAFERTGNEKHGQRAKSILEEALHLQRQFCKENDLQLADALNNLGHLLSMLGEMDAAAPLHEEALKIRELRQDLAQCHESLGGLSQVALCRGKIDESLALSRRALEMGEQHFGKYHPNTTTCLVNIAAVLANAGEFGDMLQQLMEAAKRQSLLLPAVMAFSHERHKMSFLSHASGDLDLILSAVLELNGLRQLSTSVTELTKPDANTKEDILNIVFQRKGVWLMCQKAERSMSFLDSRIERLSSIRRELAQRVFGTTSSMSSQAIEKLMTEQRDLERTLAATNRIDSMFTCVNVAEVSRCIPERACLIEFVYIHQVVPDLRDGLKHVLRRYVAAVVLPDSYCHGEQPLLFDFGALDEDIEQYMEFLSWNPNLFETLPKSVVRRKVADFFEAGHRLRERLFDRIRCRIPDLDHFIVAADGPLGKLPWQALPLQDDGYVLDLDLTISYVTSARDILTWSCEVPASACGCAVIADPTFEFPAASESSAAPQEGYQPEDDSVTVDRIIPISGKFVRVLSVGCEQSYVDQIIQQVCSGNPDSEQHGGGLGDSALRTAITQGTDRGACFGPLKHTRFEGEMVVKCLNQAAEKFYFEPTQSFFGEEASSLVLFKVGSLRILHIATHGFYLNPNLEQASREPCRFMRALKEGPYQDPWHWSGLAFAGAQTWLREGATKQSGILTAAEVRGLKLPHCELVTLSACHTGLGEMFPGEGVLGLTRAFQLAGAKRVLASQWAISDDATKDLMNAFYAELIETNEVGEALRRAQRKLRNRDGRAGWPLFWAGLKLIGNPAGTIFSASK